MKKTNLLFPVFSLAFIFLVLSSAAKVEASTVGKTASKTSAAKVSSKVATKKVAVKPVISGQVVATSSTKLTIKSGTKTYSVSLAKAKINRQLSATSTKAISLKDIKKGDTLDIFGKINKSEVTATTINVSKSLSKPSSGSKGSGQPGNPPVNGRATSTPGFIEGMGQALFGTITAINDSSITLEAMSKDSSVTASAYLVTLTSSTTYAKDRVSGVIGDLSVGAKVLVSGDINTEAKTVTAAKVDIITKELGQGLPMK